MKPTIWRWWLPPIYGDILRMGPLLGLPHYKNFTNGTIFGPGERGPVLRQILWAGHYEKALFRMDWKTICRRCHVKKRSEEMAFPISRMQEHRAIFPNDVLYIFIHFLSTFPALGRALGVSKGPRGQSKKFLVEIIRPIYHAARSI